MNAARTVAITGATGTLGRAVVARLLASGHRVRALSRRPPADAAGSARCEWVAGGVDDVAALDALVAGSDAILHLAFQDMAAPPPAGRSGAEHFVQANVVGALRMLERAAATAGRQLIFASSLAVHGPSPGAADRAVRIDEDAAVRPREFYGAHKAALEQMVLAGAGQWGINASAFRIGCVIGEYADRGRDPLAPIAADALRHGELRTRKGAYVVTAEDVADIFSAALFDERVTGQVLHCYDRWLDFADLAAPLAEILGRDVGVAVEPAPEPWPGLSNARIAARFGAWTTDAGLTRRLAALTAGDVSGSRSTP